MKAPFVRNPYNYDMDKASLEAATPVFGDELTIQSDRDEVDINTIVRRFGVTGHLPQNVRVPLTGDFTNIGSFQDAMNAINAAEDSFMQMPAELRAKLGHDPARFIEWCADEGNREEMKKYGLLRPEDVVKVPPVVPPKPNDPPKE